MKPWLIAALVAAVTWGVQYAVTGARLRATPPLVSLAYYSWGGALAFTLLALLRGDDLRVPPAERAPLLVVVLLGVVANACIMVAIRGRNATQASLIEISYPLFVMLAAWVLYGETHLTPRVAAGAGLMLAGAALVNTT